MAGLLGHHVWALGQAAVGTDEGVDTEHAGLARAEAGGRGGIIGGGQLLAVWRAHTHVGVDAVGVGRAGDLYGREDWWLVHVGRVGGKVAALEAFPAPQEAAILKHVLGVGVKGPVVALAWPAGLTWDFDEAVVEGQIVADGVLPLLGVVPVEGEAFSDELVDAPKCEPAVGRVGDRHGDEGDVAVRGLAPLQGPLPSPALGRL